MSRITQRACAACRQYRPSPEFQLGFGSWSPYCPDCRDKLAEEKRIAAKRTKLQVQATRERRAATKTQPKASQPRARTSLLTKPAAWAVPAPVTPPPLPVRQPGAFSQRAGAMDAYHLPSLGTFAR